MVIENVVSSVKVFGLFASSAQITWFSLLEEAENQVFNIVTSLFLYTPVILLLATIFISVSFIAWFSWQT